MEGEIAGEEEVEIRTDGDVAIVIEVVVEEEEEFGEKGEGGVDIGLIG